MHDIEPSPAPDLDRWEPSARRDSDRSSSASDNYVGQVSPQALKRCREMPTLALLMRRLMGILRTDRPASNFRRSPSRILGVDPHSTTTSSLREKRLIVVNNPASPPS